MRLKIVKRKEIQGIIFKLKYFRISDVKELNTFVEIIYAEHIHTKTYMFYKFLRLKLL